MAVPLAVLCHSLVQVGQKAKIVASAIINHRTASRGTIPDSERISRIFNIFSSIRLYPICLRAIRGCALAGDCRSPPSVRRHVLTLLDQGITPTTRRGPAPERFGPRAFMFYISHSGKHEIFFPTLREGLGHPCGMARFSIRRITGRRRLIHLRIAESSIRSSRFDLRGHRSPECRDGSRLCCFGSSYPSERTVVCTD